PPAVEQVVLDCLEKDAGRRPQSAHELAERFNAALGETEQEPPMQAARGESDRSPIDPNALVFQFDAWMPQRIALVKIRGFVHDSHSEVVESSPGLMRLRVGSRPSQNGGHRRSIFGRRTREPEGPPPLDLELRLKQVDAQRENRLQVTVAFH